MRMSTLLATATMMVTTTFGAVQAATVFIPEGGANGILVVNAETGKEIKRIPDLKAIHGLSGAPGVKYLVAGSFAETTPEAVQAMPELAANTMPAGSRISILSILDAGTGAVVRRIEVPGAVHHTATSPDGRYAVAIHPAAGGISIIDLERLAFVAFLPTGAKPNYAVFSPDGNTVFVTNAGNGTISEVDVAKGIVKRNFPAGTTPEHIVRSADGATLYVADANAGNVLEIASHSGEITRTFRVGGVVHGIDIAANGKTLFVSGKGENKLVAINLASGNMRTARLAPAPYHLTVIPGTGKIYVSSRAKPQVWIVNQADLKATSEIRIEGRGHQMVAMP